MKTSTTESLDAEAMRLKRDLMFSLPKFAVTTTEQAMADLLRQTSNHVRDGRSPPIQNVTEAFLAAVTEPPLRRGADREDVGRLLDDLGQLLDEHGYEELEKQRAVNDLEVHSA